MKRQLPLALCFVSGMIVLLQYFSPHPVPDTVKATLLRWTQIIGSFAFGLGIVSLWMVHLPKVKRQAPGWGYSVVTLASFVVTVVVAIFWGKGETTPFGFLY